MRVFRVSLRRADQEHVGYVWFRSPKKAQAMVLEHEEDHGPGTAEIDEIELHHPRDVIHTLNAHGSHPDNG